MKNKSQISILDSSGPSIDLGGTQHKISNSLLNKEHSFCDLSGSYEYVLMPLDQNHLHSTSQ